MKNVLLIMTVVCVFFTNSYAKPYDPVNDAEANLKILKNYRDIFRDEYGIAIDNNSAIRHDDSGVDIKGKVFLRAIEDYGFSIEETINNLIDKNKNKLSSTLPSRFPSGDAIKNLFENLELYILRLKKEDIGKANISWETRTKMYFWYNKDGISKRLDTAILNGNKELAENILATIEKYGDANVAQVRRIFIKFSGLLGSKPEPDKAVEEAKLALKKIKKADRISRIYNSMILLHAIKNGTHQWNTGKAGNFEHGIYNMPIAAYSLALSTDYEAYNHLSSSIRYDYNKKKHDPFSRYMFLLANLEMDDYKSAEKKKVLEETKKELGIDWRQSYVMEKVKTLRSYEDTLPLLAFYCFSPSVSEVNEILNNNTPRQKEYIALLNKKIEEIASKPIRAYLIVRNESIHFFKIQFEVVGNTLNGYITTHENKSKVNIGGSINKRPFSLVTLSFKAFDKKFAGGSQISLSLKDDGSFSSKNLDQRYYSVRIKENPSTIQAMFRGELEQNKEKFDLSKIEEENFTGSTLLTIAADNGNEKAIKFLLANKANVNHLNDFKSSPLIYAAKKGYVTILELLLKNGANPNTKDMLGMTPLLLAASNGHAEALKTLIRYGVALNEVDKKGYTATIRAASKGHEDCVAVLAAAGADLEIKERENNSTALMWAAAEGKTEAVRALLEYGALPNATGRYDYTALIFAAKHGKTDAVKVLLQYGANRDMKATFVGTAFNAATREKHSNTASVLKNFVPNKILYPKTDAERAVEKNLIFDKVAAKAAADKAAADKAAADKAAADKAAADKAATDKAAADKAAADKAAADKAAADKAAADKAVADKAAADKADADKAAADKAAADKAVADKAALKANLVAPAPKKPGKAALLANTGDMMGLTAFSADGKADVCIAVLAAGESPLTAVRVENFGGVQGSWKTKDVKASAMGVLSVYQADALLNAKDASFSLDVATPQTLKLCMQDTGAIADSGTRIRVVFYHKDGSRTFSILQR